MPRDCKFQPKCPSDVSSVLQQPLLACFSLNKSLLRQNAKHKQMQKVESLSYLFGL